MLWYIGPSAVLIGIAAFVVILLMAVFGGGSVLVWLRRMRGRERARKR
jgi:hypothetical protein